MCTYMNNSGSIWYSKILDESHLNEIDFTTAGKCAQPFLDIERIIALSFNENTCKRYIGLEFN